MYHNKYQLDTNDMSGLIATEQTTHSNRSGALYTSVHEYLSIFTFVHLILFIIK